MAVVGGRKVFERFNRNAQALWGDDSRLDSGRGSSFEEMRLAAIRALLVSIMMQWA